MTEAVISPASPATTSEPGHLHQTFLVGEEIYLRRIEKEDAKLTVSWRASLFPLSPQRTEAWITEELPKGQEGHYAILRTADDRIVGSLSLQRWGIPTYMRVYVDPFYRTADAWKAEVFRLTLPWLIDEQHRVSLHVSVGGDETAAIAALKEMGAWEASRSPRLINRNGERVDLVRFEYLNRQWLERLGDPRAIPLVRTGTGEARPVPASVTLTNDDSRHPPKNAIAIGQRIYLKPLDKEDAEEMGRMSRQETDTFFGHPRTINSPENQVERRLESQKEKWPVDIGFAVRLRENDKVIGEVAVIGIDYLNRYGETASWMYDPAFRGSGYGSEAKQLLLEYAFDTLGLLVVESFVAIENTRSAAALRKQGYREVGVLHWTKITNGNYGGSVVFSLTAEEWRALPRETGDDT